MFKKSLISLVILFLLVSITKADIAPDAGYTNVRSDLIIETKEDLSDYRFFIDFSGDGREIKLKSKDTTTIPSYGGGVRYSRGTVLAIPKKKLKDFGEELTFDQQNKLGELLGKSKIEGVIRLVQHSFSDVIKDSERASWSYPTYLLEREGNTLKMITSQRVTPNAGSNGGSIDFSIYGIAKSFTILGYLVFIGIPLILVLLGIWLFRKRGRKLVK